MAAATEALEASNVYPKLWIGSRPPVTARMPAFSMLVLCAAEYQPDRMVFPGVVLHAPLHDHRPTASEVHVAAAAARRVAAELQRGGRVLVTCHAGLNRSALVAALGVMQVCRMPAAEIVAMFRQRRSPDCLSNWHFVNFLNQCEAGRARVRRR
jgi:protein-tyrosine phosphatase